MHSSAILILAAGLGTRMRSSLPKVLHKVAGRTLLDHILRTSRQLYPEKIIVVVGHQAERVKESVDADDVIWVTQSSQQGTGHAVKSAIHELRDYHGDVIILNGDVPLLRPQTLVRMQQEHVSDDRAVTVLSTIIDPPTGYGRIVRTATGNLMRIVEEKDANHIQREIKEINSGTYMIGSQNLCSWIDQLSNDNAQGEYYLTDVVTIARDHGLKTALCLHDDHRELSGTNNRHQLSQLEETHRNRLVHEWMERGVTFVDPHSCWLADDVVFGRDTVVHPNVVIGTGCYFGEGCEIGPFAHIAESRIGDNVRILPFTHVEGATMSGDNPVGPYARIRPGTELGTGAKVGNFCETKKARIGAGAKVNHLSYIGDATVGKRVNVGAGTITCNYDGVNKYQTVIGDGAFIGSDTQLVAPVTVGQGAVIGAGTTVTKDVPADSLALSRTPQKVIPDWSTRKRKQ
ncbi:MAG: bifunctional UDP-N-acetylglucosamine diphosphorylase/glucosamine-1-phosphate N-acetyltransferase GlmU [Magnetococcales bacterium]|nr:bifunctional UDP-N-acetylglucosamine diphosphorylase/glucosamine-1-phosphate N-acetyltransferase GlmU [Magnetococcales bacterium]